MTTLLDNSERFSVIERAQLQKLLDEQNLAGVVQPGEMARGRAFECATYRPVAESARAAAAESEALAKSASPPAAADVPIAALRLPG